MTDARTAHLWPSPEQHLLLVAALCDGEQSFQAFRTWRERVDLTHEFHYEVVRLLPMVYANMQRQGVQDPIMARLKGAYRRAWYDTNRLFHMVQPAIAALTAEGIDVLLLKGAPLALDYYDQLAMRPMGDVDLMVAPADLDRALTTLRAAGWSVDDPDVDYTRFRHAVQCNGPEGAEIDLHWHVLYEAASDDADQALRASAEPVDFLGSRVKQLDPTSLLFLVIVHGVRSDPETPIRWIPDALMILRRRGADVDWQRLFDFAVERRLSYRLALGLSYLVDNFSARIPHDIVGRLRATRVSAVERLERTIFLTDKRRVAGSAWWMPWQLFVEYCRYADSGGPLGFVNGFTHYLRFRLGMRGRRDFARRLFRRLRRRPLADPAGSVVPRHD